MTGFIARRLFSAPRTKASETGIGDRAFSWHTAFFVRLEQGEMGDQGEWTRQKDY